MARGFVMGAIWGTVVAGFGAAALSIAVGTPGNQTSPLPPVPQVDQSPAPQASDAAPERPVVQEPTAADAPKAPAAVESTQPGRSPEPETGVTLPEQPAADLAPPEAPGQIGTDTEPPAPPQIGEAPQAPQAVSDAPAAPLSVSSDAPVVPTAQAEAPDMPAPEQALSISTDPAQPPKPAAPAPAQAEAPAPEAAQVDQPPADDPAAIPDTPDDPAQSAEDLPQLRAEPGEQDGAIGLGTSAGTLTDREPAVPQGRLPSIGGDSDAPQDAATAGTATGLGDDSPLIRFSAPAEAAPDQPRMAIVLIDDGTGPLGPDALGSFPFPVTFAIDPAHPAPQETAAAYRDLGFEVMVLADIPEGAQASDVEVSLAGALDAVPQAIGVLEDPQGGIQGSRAISTQVTEALAASGHGLVTLPKGLNTAQQLAAKAGVPSATLFRDFDGEGQDARVIRRFLDQAAFRSRQEGAVIMLGRLRADTVSALMLWGLQDRASSVALVPVSFVLRETLGE
ncbi:divergent polysaccharide deacteylase family protein [Tropicibacter oceani]|uniref:Divergent polysaccharide deacetylase family protein n=1 Tax=Tropicibacter oceani TaxID=3058420 RepID=A0ABY8QEV0_9RHOB|nr:divergent polysaccharide deacteylase family protein [Tropicibacter oceani]WGW03139.1 divergent polysaccharide deacetylase family protein [Tropicibacter oceani]